MVSKGATAVWEPLTGYASHNHNVLGSIDEFFFMDIAGIKAPTRAGTDRGYRRIRIKPALVDELDYVRATTQSVRGEISTRWERDCDSLLLRVSIPVNSEAEVYLPKVECADLLVEENGDPVWKERRFVGRKEGLEEMSEEEGFIVAALGSGSYIFHLKPSR
jgi:alpha-L-rhamnosidase